MLRAGLPRNFSKWSAAGGETKRRTCDKKKNLAPGIISPSYASGQVLSSGTLARIPTSCMAPVQPLLPYRAQIGCLEGYCSDFLIMPSGCAPPYGSSRAERTGAKGLLRQLLPMGECDVRQEGSEEMSTWQMRPLRPGLTIQTPGPGIWSPKLLPGPLHTATLKAQSALLEP